MAGIELLFERLVAVSDEGGWLVVLLSRQWKVVDYGQERVARSTVECGGWPYCHTCWS